MPAPNSVIVDGPGTVRPFYDEIAIVLTSLGMSTFWFAGVLCASSGALVSLTMLIIRR